MVNGKFDVDWMDDVHSCYCRSYNSIYYIHKMSMEDIHVQFKNDVLF